MSFKENLEKECEAYPLVGEKALYGTAGFRGKPDELKHVMLRCGMLATLRSYMLGCKAVGCMVTASHNPPSDNGIKMIDPNGGMLGQNFELYAGVMVNCQQPTEYVMKICRELNVPQEEINQEVFAHTTVIIGRDTRASSPELAQILAAGVKAMGGKVVDLGVITTPQLHFLVARANSGDREPDEVQTEDQYCNVVASRFMNFCETAELPSKEPVETIYVDGSNGVGAGKMQFLEPVLQMIGLKCEVRNTGKEVMDVLNEECGADYVQKEQKFPRNFTGDEMKHQRGGSLDGDADRIVYFAGDSDGNLQVLDGDRIAALFKRMIETLLVKIVKEHPTKSEKLLSMGVVQTAYTNGAASIVMTAPPEGLALMECTDIKYDHAVVRTGVKHLHAKAETYDVGLYFEVNGHGTVIVDFPKLDEWAGSKGCKESKAYCVLKTFLQIFNQTTGDAITNLLGVEASLKYLNMTMQEWGDMYDELPATNRKMVVPRMKLKQIRPKEEDETQLIRPADMQKEITALLAEGERAFVRPSGTEDVLRIYTEATTIARSLELADRVEEITKKHIS
eukprot:GHVN01021914.1.p1 GENE.GHVN01021914.1~~GHVN01021914.1.p1  ORF type:complete len:564 (+),score=74.11 GHVN01021914.1:84-1775(+)